MNLSYSKASVRLLSEMREVIYDKEWLKQADPNLKLYYVWRGVSENETDKRKMEEVGLRYDITEFIPLMLGPEFNKTMGHEHSLVPGTNLAYPEIYEVLEGEAYFLFEKFGENDKIEDIFAVHCLAGEKCVIPPGYAHLTVNPSTQKTVMANWVAVNNKQSYDRIKKLGGGGYFALKGQEGLNWVKNQRYHSLPKLRFIQSNNFFNLGLSKEEKIYSLINRLEKLDFLLHPEKYF